MSDELRARVSELEKELTFADSDVASKRNYIDELEREMACARKLDMDQLDQIKALQERVQRLQNTVLENIEEIKTLKARVTELETENTSLRDAPSLPSNPSLDGQITSAGLAEYLWQQRQAIEGKPDS